MLTFLLLLIIIYFIIGQFHLKGPDLRKYDRPTGKFFGPYEEDQPYLNKFETFILKVFKSVHSQKKLKARLNAARAVANNFSEGLAFDGEYIPVDTHKVIGEWVIAPGVDTSRRLLFMHGSAFFIGSPAGHRRMSTQFSKAANAAVLSIDYRLLPENSIKGSHEDSRRAYQWMLNNGPDGESAATKIFLAGDSAGGNLAIALSAWSVKHTTPTPNAVVAICPTLDITFSGPSHFYNYHRDILLGHQIGKIVRWTPSILLNWLIFFIVKIKPSNPEFSPIFGDLKQLPPTLIHASDIDILFSDSIRYTNKAKEAGSDVILEVWRNQPHDWHLVVDQSRSGQEAWLSIAQYFKQF